MLSLLVHPQHLFLAPDSELEAKEEETDISLTELWEKNKDYKLIISHLQNPTSVLKKMLS